MPKLKDWAYIINLDWKIAKGTHQVSLFTDKNLAVYFDSLRINYIPREVLSKVKDKWIIDNIFRTQDNQSVMCGFCCIAFIEYMLARKKLLGYTNLFSPDNYKISGKIIYKYFKDKYDRRSKP